MSPAELASLPTSGVAWNRLLTKANLPITAPLISNQDDDSDVIAFGKALVFGHRTPTCAPLRGCWGHEAPIAAVIVRVSGCVSPSVRRQSS